MFKKGKEKRVIKRNRGEEQQPQEEFEFINLDNGEDEEEESPELEIGLTTEEASYIPSKRSKSVKMALIAGGVLLWVGVISAGIITFTNLSQKETAPGVEPPSIDLVEGDPNTVVTTDPTEDPSEGTEGDKTDDSNSDPSKKPNDKDDPSGVDKEEEPKKYDPLDVPAGYAKYQNGLVYVSFNHPENWLVSEKTHLGFDVIEKLVTKDEKGRANLTTEVLTGTLPIALLEAPSKKAKIYVEARPATDTGDASKQGLYPYGNTAIEITAPYKVFAKPLGAYNTEAVTYAYKTYGIAYQTTQIIVPTGANVLIFTLTGNSTTTSTEIEDFEYLSDVLKSSVATLKLTDPPKVEETPKADGTPETDGSTGSNGTSEVNGSPETKGLPETEATPTTEDLPKE